MKPINTCTIIAWKDWNTAFQNKTLDVDTFDINKTYRA